MSGYDLHRRYKANIILVVDTQVPENLSDIERATTLLSGGYPQQQKSVVDRCVPSSEPVQHSERLQFNAHLALSSAIACSLPALVRSKGKAAFQAVGGPLCVLLPTFDLSLKVICAGSSISMLLCIQCSE